MKILQEHPQRALEAIPVAQTLDIPVKTAPELCPDCGEPMVREARCWLCIHCGWSACL